MPLAPRAASGRRRRSAPSRGFTLIELLIVVIVLGILAAVALPSATSERRESVGSALAASVSHVGMVLCYQRQKTADGSWPIALDPDWFLGGTLPQHPDRMAGVPQVEVVSSPGQAHPSDKVLRTGSAGAYWYNTAEGHFRARVKPLGTSEETLAFYAYVNQCADVLEGSSSGPAAASALPASSSAR